MFLKFTIGSLCNSQLAERSCSTWFFFFPLLDGPLKGSIVQSEFFSRVFYRFCFCSLKSAHFPFMINSNWWPDRQKTEIFLSFISELCQIIWSRSWANNWTKSFIDTWLLPKFIKIKPQQTRIHRICCCLWLLIPFSVYKRVLGNTNNKFPK